VAPDVSVIVRSYNRLPALCELLERLRRQDHPSFEVVVVDQSTRRDPGDEARLGALLAADPRLRVLRYPPLGGPRARNEGVRAARGERLVFIDDDDLPDGDGWITALVANLDDPACLAVTGRFLDEHPAPGPPYRDMARARARLLRFSWLKWQHVYARLDTRAQVESAMGGNAAWRRAALARFGLWDECTPVEDEPSLCYRVQAGKRPGEHLVFDPAARMIRRLGVAGGMDKRRLSPAGYGGKLFTFLHDVVAHYFPARFVLLYPAYVGLLAYQVYDWLFDAARGQRSVAARLAAAVGFTVALPALWGWWLARWGARRLRHGAPAHAPSLEPTDATRAALAGEAAVRAALVAAATPGGGGGTPSPAGPSA
jgi:glycosyltransferase involved in cell wall biosynthesis